MNQIETILNFCIGAKYFMVHFEKENSQEFGKILADKELTGINLKENEIYRSVEYKNDDVLFVLDLKPSPEIRVDNQLQLLMGNLEGARLIELVYPNIFQWVYDGLSIKAYAIVPSSNPLAHSTISRYGGTQNFIQILKQHLENISKMRKGITPDYEFLRIKAPLNETELSIASINKNTAMYSVGIALNMTYLQILYNSKRNIQVDGQLKYLEMKYWTREINPDFVSEAKHIKLDKPLATENAFNLYPPCIKELMGLPYKGNYNRFLIARFLLSVHKPHEAKFLYHSVMGDEELEHVKNGNDNTQWRYIHNNLKRYQCPSCKEMRRFCPKTCELEHPLQLIQEHLNQAKLEDKDKNGTTNTK